MPAGYKSPTYYYVQKNGRKYLKAVVLNPNCMIIMSIIWNGLNPLIHIENSTMFYKWLSDRRWGPLWGQTGLKKISVLINDFRLETCYLMLMIISCNTRA